MALRISSKKKIDIPLAKKDIDTINQIEVVTIVKLDTVKNSNKTQTEYPDWLYSINGEISEELSQYGNSEISKYRKLNDSLSFAIIEFNTGICSQYSLDTYLNKKEIDNLEISVNCAHDLSIPEYEWKEYELLTPKTIKLKEYREYVHDSLIDSNGYMKDGYDFSEAETKIDSTVTIFEIQSNGKIDKQNKN